MNKQEEVLAEIEEAKNLEHPYRLIRFTFECGHFKLAEASMSLGGIGFSTNCAICSETRDKTVSRKIVKEEETGELGRFKCFES